MAKRLDLLLVNPGSRMQVYQDLGRDLAAIEPPVWAGLMATFARKRGYSVAILDANADGLSAKETAERIVEANPLLAAFVIYGHQPSASTQVMAPAGEAARALKELAPEQKVLFVGGHVAALPERTLLEEDTDFACGGEGPITVVELLEALRSSADATAYGMVRGLYWRDGERVRVNPPAPIVQNLDVEMPGMAWDLLPMEKYRAHNWHCFGDLEREPYAALYTTLGCPYHCSFCCIQSPFKSGEELAGFGGGNTNSYRFWNPEIVADQIGVLLERYGVRNIKIADEMFVLNPKHVLGICDLLIERGYGERLNIWAYTRVDTCRPQFLDKLRRAGFRWLCLGIESASELVRASVDKGKFGEGEIFRVVRMIQGAGINVLANFIFGLPDDDRESMTATFKMALGLRAEWTNFYSAMAYPGSQLHHEAIERGWLLPDTWLGYSQHSVDTLPLPTKHLSGSDVLRFRDAATVAIYTDPSYLAMIEKKFGVATAAHIRELASRKLERKHA